MVGLKKINEGGPCCPIGPKVTKSGLQGAWERLVNSRRMQYFIGRDRAFGAIARLFATAEKLAALSPGPASGAHATGVARQLTHDTESAGGWLGEASRGRSQLTRRGIVRMSIHRPIRNQSVYRRCEPPRAPADLKSSRVISPLSVPTRLSAMTPPPDALVTATAIATTVSGLSLTNS